jgi:chromosomal replication initiator protein
MVSVKEVLRIVNIVADAFQVSPDDLLSKSRKLKVVKARHSVYKILYLLGDTKSHIGKALSRDHTTVMHGISEFDNLYNFDMNFKFMADKAMKTIIKTKYEEDTDTTEVRKG